MKKSLTLMSLLMISAIVLAGCSGKQAGKKASETSVAEAVEQVYESSNGWKVSYDPTVIKCEEKDGIASFVYTGDSAGKNEINFSYVAGKMPDEVLYDKTSSFDQEKIRRSEGNFTGGNWSFTRSISAEDTGDGTGRDIIGIEHNGGTLVIDCVYTPDSNEDRASYVSDRLADVADSFAFTKHDPQTQYSYVPGTYVRTWTEEIEGKETEITEKIILKEDHSGTLSFQDDIPVTWTSYRILTDSAEYEYSFEGGMLYLDYDGNWLEFEKETE